MKIATPIITLLLSFSCLHADEVASNYQKIIEDKYQAKVERFQVIDISERTKALWYDFEMSGEKSIQIKLMTDKRPNFMKYTGTLPLLDM